MVFGGPDMAKFLGFETMSREDHIRVGVFGVVLLSLECVLAGLVTGAEFRGWAIHAVAGGLGIWAMVGVEPLPVRATSATAIVAVVNEAVMYLDAGQSLKYIIPAVLLLGVAVWVAERSITAQPNGSIPMSSSSSFGVGPAWDDQSSSLDVPPPLPRRLRSNAWAPVLALAGVVIALFGMLEAKWVLGRALFGLISTEFTYSEIRELWSRFGAPTPIVEAFVGIAQVLAWVGVLVAILGASIFFFQHVEVDQVWRVSGTTFVGLAGAMQLVVVVGLLSAEADISVLSGAWLTPAGLGLAAIGFWVSTASS